jgi:hypothetical protein
LKPDGAKNAILVASPGYGWKSDDFVLNLLVAAMPIHTPAYYIFPHGDKFGDCKPVAEARNECVEFALEHDCKGIFFRDHDVLCPQESLGILMARDADVIGGLYVSKQIPPWPLTMRDNQVVTDWKFGDVVPCDSIGMGCTYIKTDVFRRMEGPWFATLSSGIEGTTNARKSNTEDVYFCRRVRNELGIQPYIDTAVACVHVDFNTGKRFYFNPELGLCAWSDESGEHVVKPVTKEATAK